MHCVLIVESVQKSERKLVFLTGCISSLISDLKINRTEATIVTQFSLLSLALSLFLALSC